MPVFFIAPIIIIAVLWWQRPALIKQLGRSLDEKFSRPYIAGFRLLIAYLLWERLRIWQHTPYVAAPTDPALIWETFPSLALLLQHPPALFAVQLLFAIALIGFALELKPKLSVSVLFALTIMLESYRKLPHTYYLLGLILLGYLIYHFLYYRGDSATTASRIFPVSYFLTGTLYFNSFLSKVVTNAAGWLDGTSLQAAILKKHIDWILIYDQPFSSLTHFTAGERLLLSTPLLAAVASLGVLLAQCLALFLVVMPRGLRAGVLLSLAALHIGIYLALGIPFIENTIIIVYLSAGWLARMAQATPERGYPAAG